MDGSQIKVFEKAGLIACALPVGEGNFLKIGENGSIEIADPKGFKLVIAAKKGSNFLLLQKNISSGSAVSKVEKFASGFTAKEMADPIKVFHASEEGNSDLWTMWPKNRFDCLVVNNDKLDLFRIGIDTYNNGKTFELRGEYAWRGKLYSYYGSYIAMPEHQKWGDFEGGSSGRTKIFRNPDFISIMDGIKLEPPENITEYDEPLNVSRLGENEAVVKWYETWMGKGKGQGPVGIAGNNGIVWVFGPDVVKGIIPDVDGRIRLWRGDRLKFSGKTTFGSRDTVKITGVELIHRFW